MSEKTGFDEGGGGGAEGAAAPNAAAIALALAGAREKPELKDPIAGFLDEQRGLIGDQRVHLHEQMKHLRLGVLNERLSVALKAMTALVGLAIAIAIGWMITSASRDKGLVIEAFNVPPDVAESQIRGEELASLIADRLATIDANAQSFRAAATYQLDWGHDIHIEVPTTGVSISELDKFLRDRLGHQTRIGGTLYHAGDGLRLSLRTGEGSAIEVAGDSAHIDDLAGHAAEAIFAKTQPYRYSKYLEFANRMDEAMAVARKLTDGGPAREQAWAWAQISNLLTLRDIPGAYAAGLRATKLDPNNALAFLNASNAASLMGHAQDSLDLLVKSVEIVRHGGGGLSDVGIATGLKNGYIADAQRGSYMDATGYANDRTLYRGVGELMMTWRAQMFARVHDVQASKQVEGVLTDAEIPAHLFLFDFLFSLDYSRAVALDDWPAAIASMQVQLATLAKEPEGAEIARYGRERFAWPYLARALAHAGQMDEAKRIAGALAEDCYLCLGAKAEVAALDNNWPEATRLFEEAVRQAPRLPFTHAEWGALLLAKGDAAGAIEELQAAYKINPHFADGIETWGEALLAQKQFASAAAKFAEANKYAPRWGRLHLKWGEALAAEGRAADAQKQFALAATLDLSVADKAALARAMAH